MKTKMHVMRKLDLWWWISGVLLLLASLNGLPVCSWTSCANADGKGDADATDEVEGGFTLSVIFLSAAIALILPKLAEKLSKSFHDRWRAF